jgi:hypothetical protein
MADSKHQTQHYIVDVPMESALSKPRNGGEASARLLDPAAAANYESMRITIGDVKRAEAGCPASSSSANRR